MTASASTLHPLPPLLELHDADRLVGWIDGDVVRFRGFGSERSAAHAAAVAHDAMRRRLARGNRATASETEADLGTIRRATDRANATANGRPVASVLRPFLDRIDGNGAGDFAFEVRVPPPIDELRMRGMAYVMYRALRSSGIAWPLLHPVAAPERFTAAATDTAAVTFGGFSSAEDAHGAAASAFDALRSWLATQRRTAPVPGPARALRPKHDGERWHLHLDGVSIGGIIEPGDPRADDIRGYGFELLLPPGLGPEAAVRASRVIADAIDRRTALEELIASSAS